MHELIAPRAKARLVRRSGVRIAGIALAVLIAATGTARAADAADPWSGLYGGIHGGYAWGHADYEITVESVRTERRNPKLENGVIGGQVGRQRK
jgi:hypothetical protein